MNSVNNSKIDLKLIQNEDNANQENFQSIVNLQDSLQNELIDHSKNSRQQNNDSQKYKQLLKKEQKNEIPRYLITDIGMNYNEVDDFIYNIDNQQNQIEFLKKYYKKYKDWDQYYLLILLAVITPLVTVTFMLLLDKQLYIFRQFIEKNDFEHFVLGFLYSSFFALLSTFICSYYTDAEGSGIPELKSILAGISIYRYLNFKMVIAKIIALYCSIASGLFIGREGPFVHIAASFANQLSKFKCFRRLHIKNTFRKQILATAGGIGLTATFGTPIGGCLYNIETMASFFPVSNFWKSFFCSVICGYIFHLYGHIIGVQGWELTNYPQKLIEFNNYDLIAFCVLAIICGIIGILHIKIIQNLVKFRRKYFNFYLSRYIYVFVVTFFTFMIMFFYSSFGLLSNEAIMQLFNKPDDYQFESDNTHLLLLLLMKLICNSVAISSQIPSGIFVPSILMGAIIGRLYGILMNSLFGIQNIGRFAVIGAAAFTASITHTLAISVIMFELTGQIVLLFPVLFATVISYAISQTFSQSIYHVLIEIKNLPYLPKMLSADMYRKNSYDIMHSQNIFLTLDSNFQDIVNVLQAIQYKVQAVPIVNNQEQIQLLFSIQSGDLRHYLRKECIIHNNKLPKIQQIRNTESDISVDWKSVPPNFQEYLPKDIEEMKLIQTNNEFWTQKIDFNNPLLNIDKSPFTVIDTVNVAKLHLLFSMMGLHSAFVIKQGVFIGLISVESFLQKKKI